MDNQVEWSEVEMTPIVVKIIDLWQKRGKKIEELSKDEIEEAIQYKH